MRSLTYSQAVEASVWQRIFHTYSLQAPYFGLRHGRKCEVCPTLTLSFLARPRAAHKAKPGSERGILRGLKGSLRASLQDTDRPPSHGSSRRHGGSLTSPLSCFFFLSYSRSTPGYSCIRAILSIFALSMQGDME